jgi:hypothetical protein
MHDLTGMNLDALRVELAYRRAMLVGAEEPRFRFRLPARPRRSRWANSR